MAAAPEKRLASVDRPARAIHEFEIPEDLLEDIGSSDIHSFGLYELTAREEMECAKLSKSNEFGIGYELAKRSVVEINGEPVDRKPAAIEKTWAGFSPKLRHLIVNAYGSVHNADEEKVKDFLKGRKTKV